MRALFVYPEFPKTFWSYEKIRAGELQGAATPGDGDRGGPLPQEWEMRPVTATCGGTDEGGDWAELVIIRG